MAKTTHQAETGSEIAPILEEIPGYSELKEAANTVLPQQTGYEWMIEIFATLLMTAVLSFMAGWILRIASKVISKTKTNWDDILVEAARIPLKAVIWIVGLYFALNVIYTDGESGLVRNLANLRDVAIVLMIAWALNRYIDAGIEYYKQQRTHSGKGYDYTALNAISKLLKIAVNVSAVLIALQNFGISIDGVLAFGGISGIAVGFAAQGLLSNFFGAIIIYLDKPFKVGDWIRSPDQDIEGTVEDIGWRMTTIRTFDKRPLYVPNSVFTTISVENPSRMTNRRIYVNVGIRYDDIGVMKAVVDEVRSMLQNHEEIDTNQTLIVHFNEFNASSCDFMVYTFTKTTNWVEYHAIREDVLLKIADIIDKHGAEIAYPTQVEYSLVKQLKNGEGPKPTPEPEAA